MPTVPSGQFVDKGRQNGRKVAYPQPPPKRRGAYKFFPLREDLREALPAKEVGRDACYIHHPGYQEASCDTKDKRDKQEEQACGVELQIGNEPFAEEGKDGRKDIEGQAVAA